MHPGLQEVEDRRRFLRRAGTVAWSTPIIMTLMAESAAASHLSGCIHQGNECGIVSGGSCVDDPPGSGSASDCCSPNTCQPTFPEDDQPCTCEAPP
jgi:hypothetical protein